MFQHNLKIALRNILKNRAYSIINILGLATGMMSSIFIVLWIADEVSFDAFHEDAGSIARIVWQNENPQTRTPHPMSFTLVNEMPEVLYAVSLTPIWGEGLTRPMRTVKYGENQFEERGIFAADTSFFDTFSFKILKGNPHTALKDFGGLVITEKIARKYFGDEDPLGKQLLINFQTDMPFVVTGVMQDIPSNSHIKFDFLISYVTFREYSNPYFFSWEDFGHYNYIKVRQGTDLEQLEVKLNEWTKKYIDWSEENLEALDAGRIAFKLQPINSIHLHSNVRWELEPNGDIAYVRIFSSLAIFIILIACINFMNLATAKVSNRSVEIGLKKTVGASRWQLIWQFYGEAFLSSLIALAIALVLFEVFSNSIGSLTGKIFLLDYADPRILSSLIALLLFCSLAAGSYPAFVLSKFSVSNIIKGAAAGRSHKFNFRKGLVVFQFSISTFLIIGALVIGSQLRFMREQKMGFDSENILVIPIKDTTMRNNYESAKLEFLTNSNIISVSAVSNLPGKNFNQNPVRWKNDESVFADVSEFSVDHDFFKTLGLKIVSGRQFDRNRVADFEYAFIINEETASRFDWSNAVAEEMIWFDDDTTRTGEVIGVVEDFHFQSLHKSIEPMIINVFPSSFNFFLVRVNSNQLNASLDHLEKVYSKIDHKNNFTFYFMDDELNNLYHSEERVESIFTYFTVLAIIISCVGLFGLSSYDAERRTKEIGIRKVNGASAWVIISLMSKDFMKWVLMAFIIACPLSWMVMRDWLNDFAYHSRLDWYNFLFTGLIVMGIGILTVGIHSVRTAKKNPVDVLKYE